ncbi:MAG: L-threonylcarbamoyladenylate synthase [Solirubrobacteraceae bacterium]
MATDIMRQTRLEAATAQTIASAGDLLRRGRLVAFPTETVYGLGADATSDTAVAEIFAAKARPSFNPLIAHVADAPAAFDQGVFSPAARRLAEAFWPGPLTLVVRAAAHGSVSLLARAGLDSVALRVPAHPVARALIAAAGRPIAAPSANRSGRVSPTAAEHVLHDLDGRIDVVLDGGTTTVGIESTIVSCLGPDPILLRPGGLTSGAIEHVLGRRLARAPRFDNRDVHAPGMLPSHYAPRAALRPGARDIRSGEDALDFGASFASCPTLGTSRLDLSPAGDLTQAAANLFRYLRELDAGGAPAIAVAVIPSQGLGEAINDRLARAAAPRGAVNG